MKQNSIMQQLSTDKIAFSHSQNFHTKGICFLLSIISPTNLYLSKTQEMLPFLVLVPGKGCVSSGIVGGGRTGPESGLLLTVPSANRIYRNQGHTRG